MRTGRDVVASPCGRYSREVTLALPDEEPGRLCVFLDAEVYLDRMGALTLIEDLLAEGRIEPAAFLFVSHVDEEHRHRDLACDEKFAGFVAEDVVGWARERFPSLETGRHVVSGLSLSGLESACILLRHPDRFGAALCQSGSFWWNGEWLTRQIESPHPGRFYVSVGDGEVQSGLTHAPTGMRQEVSQRDAVERFVGALKEQGIEHRFEVFEGGHDHEAWIEDLPRGLSWLLGA